MNTMTKATNLSRMTATVLFSTLALSFAALCPAEDNTVQETVKYGDLDVSRATDAAQLYARIRIAAIDVCRSLDHGDLGSKALSHRCVDQAITVAVAKVDLPALYSVYNAKNAIAKPLMFAAGNTR
jgi:UrcA family protein